MQPNGLPDLHSISAGDWGALSKNERAALQKTQEYKDAAAAFRAKWENNPAVEAALTNAFASLCEERIIGKPFGNLQEPDATAVSALVRHLSLAYYDPDVQGSKQVFRAVANVIAAIGSVGLSDDADIDIAALFGRPARSATNQGNAKKPRLEGKEEARALSLRWFAEPGIYKNRAAFKRDITEKGWCKDLGTAARWLAEFIDSHAPAGKWMDGKKAQKNG